MMQGVMKSLFKQTLSKLMTVSKSNETAPEKPSAPAPKKKL